MLIHWILTGLCLVLAAFFNFALIGYRTLAVLLFCAAAVIAVFGLLSRLRRQGRYGRAVKVVRTVLCCCLAVGTALFCVLEGFVLRGAKTDAEAPDYMIVLGAGVNGTVPSLSLVNRLTAARDWLREHPDCVAILSGGQGSGEDITEAEAMYRWLTAEGIPAEQLVMEDRATTTRENLLFSIEMIAEREDPARTEIAIVSSEYHLCRARTMARSLGYEMTGVAGKTTYPVLKLNYFVREAFALLHFAAFGW